MHLCICTNIYIYTVYEIVLTLYKWVPSRPPHFLWYCDAQNSIMVRLIGPWSQSATPCSPCAFGNYLTLLWLIFSLILANLCYSFFLSPVHCFPISVCVHGVGAGGAHVYHNLGVEVRGQLSECCFSVPTICGFQV